MAAGIGSPLQARDPECPDAAAAAARRNDPRSRCPAGVHAHNGHASPDSDSYPNPRPPYRLELLPIVPPFYRRARQGTVDKGELVYYGPAPVYYGIGEVIATTERFVLIDFRGTGMFGVHEETIERHYVLPVPNDRLGLL